MTENEIRDRLFGTEERKPNRPAMNKTEALEAVRFLRHSLFNTPATNKLLDNIESYILTHDAEVVKSTLNSIYGTHLEEVER